MKTTLIKAVSINGSINNRRITESYIKNNHPELYLKILNNFKMLNISFNEMMYLIVNDLLKPPVCSICGKSVKFKKFSQGYSKYCSMKCIGLDDNVQKKRENTSLHNFGEKYTLQSKKKREIIKQRNLNKYGVEYPQQSDVIKEKTKKTYLNKYGVSHHLKLKTQQEKQKNTLLNNYGVDNPMKSNSVKSKMKQTLMNKYGVDSYSKTDEFKDKIKNINQIKYGVDHSFSSETIKDKILNTNMNKYGCSSFTLTPEFIEKVKITKKNRYGDDRYNNRLKAKNSCLLKYGVDNVSKSLVTINKIRETVNNEYKLKYSTLLNINPDDIIINNSSVIVNKYCDKHNSFEITKSLLYSRLIFNKHENICTICNPIAKNTSILENELKLFVKSLNIELIENDTTILKNGQEIDIYLPTKKLGIEFNGIFWHSNLFKEKKYHLNKTNECEANGIQLLHIFDDEWIYKKNIVKSIIKSKVGIYDKKIFARKCTIIEISTNTCNDFLNTNHIQGSINSCVKLGLLFNGELVSVMTLEKLRKGLGNLNESDDEYNLNRFCNKLNHQVIGGASKLLKYFIKKYIPRNIITFADRRYSQGKLYDNLNFSKVHINPPTYFYFNSNKKQRYHRFTYRKDVLVKLGWFNGNKTIDEILLEHKLYKIYDCGTIKYQLKI